MCMGVHGCAWLPGGVHALVHAGVRAHACELGCRQAGGCLRVQGHVCVCKCAGVHSPPVHTRPPPRPPSRARTHPPWQHPAAAAPSPAAPKPAQKHPIPAAHHHGNGQMGSGCWGGGCTLRGGALSPEPPPLNPHQRGRAPQGPTRGSPRAAAALGWAHSPPPLNFVPPPASFCAPQARGGSRRPLNAPVNHSWGCGGRKSPGSRSRD